MPNKKCALIYHVCLTTFLYGNDYAEYIRKKPTYRRFLKVNAMKIRKALADENKLYTEKEWRLYTQQFRW